MSCCFRVLYSRHLTQKRRTYHDGFVKLLSSRTAVLFSEDGVELSTTMISPSTTLTESTEDFRRFEGFVVDFEEECQIKDLPKNKEPVEKTKTGPPRWSKLPIGSSIIPKQGIKKRKQPQTCPQRPRTDDEILDLFRPPGDKLDSSKKTESFPVLSSTSNPDSTKLTLKFELTGFKPDQRRPIPDTFESQSAFQKIWKNAIQEEMQIKIDLFSSKFHSILERSTTGQFEFKHLLKSAQIEYFDSTKIEVFKKRDKNQEDSVFLTLSSLTPTTRKDLRKGDLWILSSDPGFLFEWYKGDKRPIIDQVYGPWNVLFFSLWHQPTKQGKIRTQLISKHLPEALINQSELYAIRGPFLGIEILLWEALGEIEDISEPIMDALMNYSFPQEIREVQLDHLEEIKIQFGLNEGQMKALEHVGCWMRTPDSISPICLIHGPFGTGKSSLLIAIMHLIHNMVSEMRVLVCAHTNIAVDRILQGLLETGIHNFIRIGSTSKIAKKLQNHSFHSTEIEDSESTQKTDFDSAIFEGQIQSKKAKLTSTRIIGVTCCSVVNPLLLDQTFDILILDECSQIIEPLSLLPLIKSKAKFLVAAGDPCQLPPVISSPCTTNERGLGRTLFSRLHTIGHISHFLSVQYRCHPVLCEIPNSHFYDHRLETGCSIEDRAPLIEDWPILGHLQIEGKANFEKSTRSRWNRPEANAVINLLHYFIDHEISVDQIGVICFFRAQVTLIQAGLMQTRSEGIQVSTVDSFQGMEKEVIVLSMSVHESDDFASDLHRLNVALTRAKRHLIIVGNRVVLEQIAPCLSDLLRNSTSIKITKSNEILIQNET